MKIPNELATLPSTRQDFPLRASTIVAALINVARALGVCLLFIAGASGQGTVAYTTFQGQNLTMTPWFGDNVVVLTLSPDREEEVMRSIVRAIDQAYAVYEHVTGRHPTRHEPTTLDGRSTVAEVPDGATCGAACAYLGLTGIEIASSFFDSLYEGVRLRDEYDQAVFYELGRNFWFYSPQLDSLAPFVTGFAIANRFLSMEVANLEGGPFGNIGFDEFRNSILFDLLDSYLSDPSLDWRNTLLADLGPPNPYGWGAADLAAAMFYRIYDDFGMQEYGEFWRALRGLPQEESPEGAVNNFLTAAKEATGQDYGFLFKDIFVVPVPMISSNGVVNAASFLGGAVASGEIVSIFGANMGPNEGVGAMLDNSGRVATTVADTQVLFDGIPAPLFFVRADQINAQVPYGIDGRSSAQLRVRYQDEWSGEQTVPVSGSAPGIFVYPDGSDRAIVVHLDGTLNSPSNPAAPDDIVVLYATGEGQTNPPGVDGKLSVSPFPTPLLAVSLMIGGVPADILFAGSAPGFAGLLQVNAKVPLVEGEVPVILTIGEASSQEEVTMAVAQPGPPAPTTYMITTVAGTGVPGFSGDGGPSTLAQLNQPQDVALDGSGNLYIADTANKRIRKVTTDGLITTVVGGGSSSWPTCPPSCEGRPASEARLCCPQSVTLSTENIMYIAEPGVVYEAASDGGSIGVFAGSSDQAEVSVDLHLAAGVAADAGNNLYIVDGSPGYTFVYKVSPDRVVSQFAGTGSSGFSGDGGPASLARFHLPSHVDVSPGGVYIADRYNFRIRKVTPNGVISTVAGGGTGTNCSPPTEGQSWGGGFCGDGGPATQAELNQPQGVTLDASGNLYIADTSNNRIRKVDLSGVIQTIAGSGNEGGFSGDGGPAKDARLNLPFGVAVDSAGNIYVADRDNHRIRKLMPM